MNEKPETQDYKTIANLYEGSGLGSPNSVENLAATSGNTKYDISTSQGETVLTVFENRTLAQVSREYTFLHGLGTAAFPVAKALGKLCTLDGKPTLVTEFIPGTNLPVNEDNLLHLTEIIGQLHSYSLVNFPTDKVRHDPRGAVTRLEGYSSDDISEQDVAEIRNDLLTLCDYRFINDTKISKALIHADPTFDNARLTLDNRVVVIDFDNLREDVVLIDLACLIESWLLAGNELNDELILKVFDHYEMAGNSSLVARELFPAYLHFVMLDRLVYYLNLLATGSAEESDMNEIKRRMELRSKFRDLLTSQTKDA